MRHTHQAHDVNSEYQASAEKEVKDSENNDLTLEYSWFFKSCFELIIPKKAWIVES